MDTLDRVRGRWAACSEVCILGGRRALHSLKPRDVALAVATQKPRSILSGAGAWATHVGVAVGTSPGQSQGLLSLGLPPTPLPRAGCKANKLCKNRTRNSFFNKK